MAERRSARRRRAPAHHRRARRHAVRRGRRRLGQDVVARRADPRPRRPSPACRCARSPPSRSPTRPPPSCATGCAGASRTSAAEGDAGAARRAREALARARRRRRLHPARLRPAPPHRATARGGSAAPGRGRRRGRLAAGVRRAVGRLRRRAARRRAAGGRTRRRGGPRPPARRGPQADRGPPRRRARVRAQTGTSWPSRSPAGRRHRCPGSTSRGCVAELIDARRARRPGDERGRAHADPRPAGEARLGRWRAPPRPATSSACSTPSPDQGGRPKGNKKNWGQSVGRYDLDPLAAAGRRRRRPVRGDAPEAIEACLRRVVDPARRRHRGRRRARRRAGAPRLPRPARAGPRAAPRPGAGPGGPSGAPRSATPGSCSTSSRTPTPSRSRSPRSSPPPPRARGRPWPTAQPRARSAVLRRRPEAVDLPLPPGRHRHVPRRPGRVHRPTRCALTANFRTAAPVVGLGERRLRAAHHVRAGAQPAVPALDAGPRPRRWPARPCSLVGERARRQAVYAAELRAREVADVVAAVARRGRDWEVLDAAHRRAPRPARHGDIADPHPEPHGARRARGRARRRRHPLPHREQLARLRQPRGAGRCCWRSGPSTTRPTSWRW